MAAVRVPPSAWSTSQSRVMVWPLMALWSSTARSERPIRRWISWVRPDCPPILASRRPRVCVAPGSMPYSAVSQPLPESRSQGGTRRSTLAVHNTRVLPKEISTEPAAFRVNSRWMVTGRSACWARPLGRSSEVELTMAEHYTCNIPGRVCNNCPPRVFHIHPAGGEMTRSMTAFAREQVNESWGQCSWELRSLNHRYRDLHIRLPEPFRALEPEVRERIEARLSRGKVECTLRFQPCAEQTAGLE